MVFNEVNSLISSLHPISPSAIMSLKARCEVEVAKYLLLFEIPSLSTQELQTLTAGTYLLIDVRTPEEILVSRIPGSITQAEFSLFSPDDLNDKTLITTCTVGYRSGVQATLLRKQFPSPSTKIYNHEGIVPYTHACEKSERMLVKPNGKPTTTVHTYGSQWAYIDETRFEAVHFPQPLEFWKTLRHVLPSLTMYFFARMKK